LEDCLLSEQPAILKEFFGNRSGYLPEGSVLLFGSFSHLAMRGIETYAEEVVKNFKIFTNMLARGCTVAHTVHFPLGGTESESVIRDAYDLDAWLRSGVVGQMLSLPVSRECFWKVVVEDCGNTSVNNTGERIYFLPESISNSRKIRTVSGSLENKLPEKILPLSENSEKILVRTLMNEITEKFAIVTNPEPCLNRCSGDNVFSENFAGTGRIFAIGASHVTRLVGSLADTGTNVVNLAGPGWKLSEQSAVEIVEKLRKNHANQSDVLLIDPLSNSVYCGSDPDGNHVDQKRSTALGILPVT
jgi:hypothetical protein